MKWRVPFGDLTTDVPGLANPGLHRANNAIPAAAGYRPLNSLVVAVQDPLDDRARGAISGIDTVGNAYHYVGDETKLYEIQFSGLLNRSRLVGGAYGALSTAQWHFLQFENTVIALNPNDDIQSITIGDPNFAQLSVDAPRARYIGFIGPQIVVGNLVSDPILGVSPNTFRYPAIGNPSSWPDPTDPDAALPVQAGSTEIRGGGRITGIVSGSELGAVFQESQISRVEYVGGDVIYQVDTVEQNGIGLIAPRAAVAFGRKVLFLSQDGWRIFDYTQSTPIAESVINASFILDYDDQYPDRVSATLIPGIPVIIISYAGAGNTGGTPNRLILWNFKTNRWATGDSVVELLTHFVPLNVTLDDLLNDLDVDYLVSFDELVTGFGEGILAGYNTDHNLVSFRGPSLEAKFETGDREHIPGRFARVKKVFPLVQGVEPTLEFSARPDLRTAEDAISYISASAMNREGAFPVRGARGRYHRYRLTIPAGWTDYALGLDVVGEPGGER